MVTVYSLTVAVNVPVMVMGPVTVSTAPGTVQESNAYVYWAVASDAVAVMAVEPMVRDVPETVMAVP